ncbi:hypothetical protein [Clostridium sp.]|uniref:hypothetical protein n=1 Tax=Clostridium sp. TaxID=1506 RepID=UPI003217094D
MENENLYMRINYGRKDSTIIQDKKSFIGNKKENTSRYLLAGGIYNKNGGTIMFKANNAEEARDFANHNILNNNKLQELKRDIIILPKYICEEK